jgi:hypothetical protein
MAALVVDSEHASRESSTSSFNFASVVEDAFSLAGIGSDPEMKFVYRCFFVYGRSFQV